MAITIIGSIAYDSVKTPYHEAKHIPGGSATYASVSASYFTDVSVVGIVGKDGYNEFINIFKSRNIDTNGLECSNGKTFCWKGEYKEDFNTAITHETCLNVFANFNPVLPDSYKQNNTIFLGNIAPELQLSVLKQCKNTKIKAMDTMNFWINSNKEMVIEVIKKVDILIINHHEARLLTGKPNQHKAAEYILQLGLPYIIIKQGEFGSALYSKEKMFILPAYPTKKVIDPTGAGDSFAGGVLGYLDKKKDLNFKNIATGLFYGTIMASLNIENFSVKNLLNIDETEIQQRFNILKEITKI